jgi:hypothetical protein
MAGSSAVYNLPSIIDPDPDSVGSILIDFGICGGYCSHTNYN